MNDANHSEVGNASAKSNHALRDEICDYWSMRAETFDLQPGHEIFSEGERTAWHSLIQRHFKNTKGKTALDVACGTGVITHLLDDLGYNATGIDWSETMLEKAKAKAKKRGRKIRFLSGDAENTRELDETYDVIITRHLVWTLVDPEAAFQHWINLLKPGGTLLIIDGDFVAKNFAGKILQYIQKKFSSSNYVNGADRERHNNILRQVYFSEGAKAEKISELLENAGFENIHVQDDLSDIHKAQSSSLGLLKSLARRSQHRYAISSQKPIS